MAKSKVIETKRLLIKPFSKNYLTKKYISWLNNPKVVRFSEQRHKTHTLQSCQKYLNSFKNSPHYFWAIIVKTPPEKHIGNLVARVDKFNKTADLSILIGDTTVWGKGYGTEAWRAVVNFLFNKLKFRKITAGTLAVNKPMLKVMEKSGMINDGQRAKQFLWEGQEIDGIHKAIFKKLISENKKNG